MVKVDHGVGVERFAVDNGRVALNGLEFAGGRVPQPLFLKAGVFDFSFMRWCDTRWTMRGIGRA